MVDKTPPIVTVHPHARARRTTLYRHPPILPLPKKKRRQRGTKRGPKRGTMAGFTNWLERKWPEMTFSFLIHDYIEVNWTGPSTKMPKAAKFNISKVLSTRWPEHEIDFRKT